MRAVAKVQEAGLIVAASVRDVDGSEEGVFDFVFVAGGDAEIRKQITRLRGDVGAVVLETAVAGEIAELGGGDGRGIALRAERVGIGGEKTLLGIVVDLAGVGFGAAYLVMPVFAGGEIPAGAGTENMLAVALIEIGRFEERLAGDAGDAVVVAKS